MRTASEKLAIIRLVEDSELSVRRTLDEIKVSRASFSDAVYIIRRPRSHPAQPDFL